MSFKRASGYHHREAFMLMWYACQCGHREVIWNSRDGVTPFGCGCPSCGGVMNHVDWGRDEYAPNHNLHPRQRFWRDGTEDEAEAIMRRRIERVRVEYQIDNETESKLIAEARNGASVEFQTGWPMLEEYAVMPKGEK